MTLHRGCNSTACSTACRQWLISCHRLFCAWKTEDLYIYPDTRPLDAFDFVRNMCTRLSQRAYCKALIYITVLRACFVKGRDTPRRAQSKVTHLHSIRKSVAFWSTGDTGRTAPAGLAELYCFGAVVSAIGCGFTAPAKQSLSEERAALMLLADKLPNPPKTNSQRQ